MKTSTQIKRIRKFEAIYEELTAAADELRRSADRLSLLKEKAEALEKYYTGSLWKRDFAADEAGLLPPELKRGVLSEDGVYDLLEELGGLRPLLDLLES